MKGEMAVISGVFPVQKKKGAEHFQQGNVEMRQTVKDFWGWAYSDLLENTARGKLAEYIVAIALDIADGISPCWGKYDLDFEGNGIEVKTSAYLQSWKQDSFSKIIFNVPRTQGWNPETNRYDPLSKRQAKVYVFCVFKHLDENTVNPMNLDQWEFYVVSTTSLEELAGNQKTISLTRLKKNGFPACDFAAIKQHVTLALNE